MDKKISTGALEGSYAVVLANYAIVFGKIIKDMLIHGELFLFLNSSIFCFILIGTINIIIEWVALKRVGDTVNVKIFTENILTLVLFFIVAQIFSEIYPLTGEITIYNIGCIIAISNLILFTLYFVWNLQYLNILHKTNESGAKAMLPIICNVISFVINLALLVVSLLGQQEGVYTLLVVFYVDSVFNCIISSLALTSKKNSLPLYYVIEPTSRCNYHCSICPHSIKNGVDEGDMDINLYKSIIKQIQRVAKVIQLYWMGEPLLHSKLFEMIRLAKEKTKAKVVISTNGSLLTCENIEALLDSGVDKIIVSCDAADSQEIYKKIRCGGDIEKVNKNLELLLVKAQRYSVEIELQFIEMFLNKEEKEKFENKWKGKNCKTSISCLYDWAGQMKCLKEKSDNLSPVRNAKRSPCCDLWKKMCIHYNGKVALCCFDFNTKVEFGDANHTKLSQIWNNDIINHIRNEQMNGRFNMPLCENCDAWAIESEYDEL